ncbi:hypothetical protein J1N35_023228 [Gossypium stocksii]|uniref:Uncharacterized protein n=1 Tax=Gossypium stocksii TaxID=47602 RepID=A0A9D4A3H7_9ROSI|nr:hypothetical protein J1N35_023228 [Gossypium stocksii]
MTIAESLIELVVIKNKFESSKPNEKGNDEGDDEGHVKNDNGGNSGNGKPHNGKWKPNNKLKELVKWFLCYGLHRMQDSLERSKLPATSKEDEAEPD